VVATRVGGNPELVDDHVTGRLVESGDLAALAQTITEYASDGALRRQHGEAARQAAVQQFSLTKMVERYQALYDHLARGTPFLS